MADEHPTTRRARRVTVVPHTHWDREWYAAFQTYRLRLVEMLDDLLPMLEDDPSFTHFMLDGQMAVVDDYLAIRPEQAARLRALAVSGRLGMGPWYILMDEFLVSGETIVRNLQLGLERAAAFGGATPVGYLPDMFGHIAQMPQLLRQFGFDHAVVWRGVPAAIDRTAFWWIAPDGSTVRAEYLPEGYGNGASLPDDAKALVGLVDKFVAQYNDFFVGSPGPVLWMNGTDHLLPRPWLGRVVAEANALQQDYELVVGSLADHVTTAPIEGLPAWTGELRSGARANLLMGVASNRVDVKQAAAAAERSLERYAEPLSALFFPPDHWPGAFLDVAWLEVIRNSAHDSSCACSHDEVCDAVNVRYQEARQIGDGLTARVVEGVRALLAEPGPTAVNPTARTRRAVIEVVSPGSEVAPGAQLVEHLGGPATVEGLSCRDASIRVRAALDEFPNMHTATAERGPDGVLDIQLAHDPARLGARYDGSILAEVQDAARIDPDAPARLTITTPAAHRALVAVDDIPPFGWRRWSPDPVRADGARVTVAVERDPEAPELLTDATIVSDLVTVVVDGTDATFAIADPSRAIEVAGLGRLVDDADSGDTYNFNPTAGAPVVDEPESIDLSVVEEGPLRARVRLTATYRIDPERIGPDIDDGRTHDDLGVITTIEVLAGSPVVRVSVSYDNRWEDHRLRAWFPLPRPADRSVAECAFAVVERGLHAEGGPTEPALATYPSRRFVCAGGLTVVHDGLLEYELVDLHDDGEGEQAGALALTLLRATGAISRDPMPARPLPAGPRTATPGAQLPGRRTVHYGVALGDDVPAAYAAADDAFVPVLACQATGAGTATDHGSLLRVDGAEVSSVRREQGRVVVRVFNPSHRPARVTIADRRGWLVDLRGRPVEAFEESFALDPWAIATASLDER